MVSKRFQGRSRSFQGIKWLKKLSSVVPVRSRYAAGDSGFQGHIKGVPGVYQGRSWGFSGIHRCSKGAPGGFRTVPEMLQEVQGVSWAFHGP